MYLKFLQTSPVSESLFNKVADLSPTTLLKRTFRHRRFVVNFAKFQLFYGTPLKDGSFWI